MVICYCCGFFGNRFYSINFICFFLEEIKEFGICVVFILIWHLLLKKDSPSFSSSSTNHISSNRPNRIFDVTHRSHRDHYHLPDQINSSKSVYRGILPVFSMCVCLCIFLLLIWGNIKIIQIHLKNFTFILFGKSKHLERWLIWKWRNSSFVTLNKNNLFWELIMINFEIKTRVIDLKSGKSDVQEKLWFINNVYTEKNLN